ncbi:MAG TPA: copper chaperone [Candidatus Tenderia sp.]|nr:copper chaperone [Candidatus Tenderia sp.]
MKKRVAVTLAALFWSAALLAAGTQYNLRVDGLACPFCAYGVEKKLINSEGVESVSFDLEKGLVKVKTRAGVSLTEEHLKKLVNDAGFTLRSMTEEAL